MDSQLQQLYGRFPGWECWKGVSGLFYARWRRSTPPVVVRASTPDALARKIEQAQSEADQ